MESFCRLCCTSHKVNKLNHLLEDTNSHLLEKLNHFAGSILKIYVNDGLYICIRCTSLLEAAYEFKLICESAEAKSLAASQTDYKKDDDVELPKLYCDVCGFHETNKNDLTEHMKVHRTSEPTSQLSHGKRLGGSFLCDICRRSYMRKGGLVHHMRTVHQPLTNKKKPCNKAPIWICETCGKEYKSKISLKHHINGAHEAVVKNYSCNLCDYKGRQARSLLSHQQVHSGEKRLKCSECGALFGFRSSLYRHVESVHRRNKRHKCTVCDQSFYTTLRLKEHYFVHTGQQPHNCTVCSRTYRYSNSLSKHMRKRHPEARKQKDNFPIL